MKKLFSLLSVAALLLCLLGTAAYAATGVAGSIDAYGNQEEGYILGAPDGTPATIIGSDGSIEAVDSGYGYTGGKVVVTKSPTGEKVEKGGKASFTAYASSGAAPTWRLVSSDTLETIYALDAKNYFDNLVVTLSDNGNRLTLNNIGDKLNGWQVEAMFDDGEGGYVFSAGARITVVGSTANGTTTDKEPNGRSVAVGGNGSVPSINGQPTGATLTSGKSTTLSVTAGTNDGGKLHYQWYVYKEPDTGEEPDPQAIAGATSASYTPGEIPGTRYYYCAVWSEKDGVKSETVYSEAAAVTYATVTQTPAPTAVPTPAPASTGTSNTGTSNTGTSNTGTANTGSSNTAGSGTSNTGSNSGTSNTGSNQEIVPQPSDPVAEATPAPSPAAGTATAQVETENRSSLPVVLGAIAAVALAAGVGLLVLRRNAGQ